MNTSGRSPMGPSVPFVHLPTLRWGGLGFCSLRFAYDNRAVARRDVEGAVPSELTRT